ncbi:excinuclease ABC subunit UvrB [Patescibacteria group bacterium]|nr:excinuclease ABC subunit UvrB [Patescibacteria group bacterium]
MKFKIHSKYKPEGDQPKAIDGLFFGLNKGMKKQILLGVTGSGKTFTIANVIEKAQMPTLVIAHNKTLAAQLCNEFREFFPDNAVEYFVSYYDYYQPEAYIPSSDTYIEKEAMINEEIDRLRHACTQALLTRRDVIIVASVSAIYGLGSPKEYEKIVLHLHSGQELNRRGMLEQLIAMQFERTNSDLTRGSFRMTGPVFEIVPVNEEMIYRLEIGDKINRIEMVDPVTRKVKKGLEDIWLFPAKHYVVGEQQKEKAFASIRHELGEQLKNFEEQKKVLEHERLKRRVNYDLEMIKNIGYCNGIENYSRHFDNRTPGEPPFTLLDYFAHNHVVTRSERRLSAFGGKHSLASKDCHVGLRPPRNDNAGIAASSAPRPPRNDNFDGFLTIIDESHVTVPQIGGMYFGDKSRKDVLVDHGFRLPSARDNRPLTFEEFETRVGQTIYVSATPRDFELQTSDQVVEQVVRPTGLIDPEVIIRPVTGRAPSVIANEEKRSHNKQTSEGIATSPSAPRNDNRNLSQIEDLIIRIEERVLQNERVLVTTLTKKMAEDLSEYLEKKKIKVKYMHSGIETIERIEIIMALRKGDIDVIVGVNLLREGLDMPEVSLVAILDADKEGFLRNATSLIQTIGRAARNVNGQVVLYADNITKSIKKAIDETERRREIQVSYNKKHGITPKTIEKNIRNILEEFGIGRNIRNTKGTKVRKRDSEITRLDLIGDARPLPEIINDKEKQMKEAAKNLEFELAAILRDEIRELKRK